MACRDAPPATSIQHGMDSDEPVLLEDADLARSAVNLDRTAARAVGHAVEVAVDRDHTIAGDAAFEAQDSLERPGRERLKLGALFGKMLGDDAPEVADQFHFSPCRPRSPADPRPVPASRAH
jgi:hypothetical protein